MMVSRTETILRRERMTITLPHLIEQFCATKQVEVKTLKTKKCYRETLHRNIVYSTNGHELTLAGLNLENARAYVASLQQQQVRWEG